MNKNIRTFYAFPNECKFELELHIFLNFTIWKDLEKHPNEIHQNF